MSKTDINQQDGNGRTLLHLACQDDNTKKVSILVDKGAKIDIYDAVGFTPAHIAIEYENIEVLKYLATKFDLSKIRDHDNEGTLLHLASQSGNTSIIKILIDAGVSVTAQDNNAWTALNFAVMGEDPEPVALLIKYGADVNYRHTNGYTPLFSAVYAGNQKICELLLDAGANINDDLNEKGKTPLTETKKKKLIEYLVSRGAISQKK